MEVKTTKLFGINMKPCHTTIPTRLTTTQFTIQQHNSKLNGRNHPLTNSTSNICYNLSSHAAGGSGPRSLVANNGYNNATSKSSSIIELGLVKTQQHYDIMSSCTNSNSNCDSAAATFIWNCERNGYGRPKRVSKNDNTQTSSTKYRSYYCTLRHYLTLYCSNCSGIVF
jgi:hypothetical protein